MMVKTSARSTPSARGAGWAAVVAAALLLQGLGAALPAAAAVPVTPARTWGVGPAMSTSASDAAPRVLAILPVGDRIVVGGTFDSVIDPAGKEYPVNNIAVFSASTGAADLSFTGAANNTVTSLATDGAGTVFVGGTFGTMNGVRRNGLAALDATTGALRPWDATIVAPGQVDDLAYVGGAVYAGGNFSAVSDGSASSGAFLAKLDAQSGALDPGWAPAPNDRVRAIDVAADGSGRIFIGGDFTSVSGRTKTNKVAALFTSSGALDPTFQGGPTNEASYAPVYDLSSDTTRLYVAAGGRGGACTAQDLRTGATRWSDHTNGNLESVRLSGGLLYCAGHFNGTGSFAGQTRYKIAAVDPATGSVDAFSPQVNSSQGVWSMASDASRVYVGGDFSSISGVDQPHFAMFVDTTAQTAPMPPSAPTALAGDQLVQLAWAPPSSDGGSAVTRYRVYRATTPGGQALTKAPLASLSRSTTSFTDLGVVNGTTYYYVVVATNALGSSQPSTEVSATPQAAVVVTPPGAPTDLSATTSPGSVALTWSAPTSTGGEAVSSYRIYRGTTPGGEDLGTPLGSSSTTAFDDTTVTPGTTYSYVVTAVNSAGEGPLSSEVTATASTTTPGQPTLSGSLVASSSGAVSAVLEWTIPADGGSPILKYVILRDAVRLTTLTATETGPTTYTDTTIPPGSHVYQVKAVNAVGSGPLSNKVTVTAP